MSSLPVILLLSWLVGDVLPDFLLLFVVSNFLTFICFSSPGDDDVVGDGHA